MFTPIAFLLFIILLFQIKNLSTLHFLTKKIRKIMDTQEQAAAKLNQVADQLAKVQAEVQALKDQAGQEPVISEALQAAIDRVAAAAQTVDDINPDAPVSEPAAGQPAA